MPHEIAKLKLSRRALLGGAAAAIVTDGFAATVQTPGIHRYKVGDSELIAIDDGIWRVKIERDFLRNASRAAVNRALSAASLPTGILPITFTVLLVRTTSKVVMIDAGTGGQVALTAGSMMANLAAAGVAADAIDTILISHFHPDHINGLKTKDGTKVFANAEILVPEPEWAFWMDETAMNTAPDRIKFYFRNARRVFADLAQEVRRFKPGDEVAPGITSVPAFGHTPGHTAFVVASGGQSLMVVGDAVRNPYLFARYPQWQPRFDMDGPLAVQTRMRMLDMAAAERSFVEAYHFPFPACGHIARRGNGYEFEPVDK